MEANVTNIIIVGLGGQGVLKASDIVAEAAFHAGYDAKSSVVRGMSKRGGSVTGDVRFDKNVLSPMIPAGEADYVVVLEESQEKLVRHRLRPNAQLVRTASIDKEKLPSANTLNMAALGLLSTLLKIPESAWIKAIQTSFPSHFHESNIRAFQLGRTTKKEVALPAQR